MIPLSIAAFCLGIFAGIMLGVTAVRMGTAEAWAGVLTALGWLIAWGSIFGVHLYRWLGQAKREWALWEKEKRLGKDLNMDGYVGRPSVPGSPYAVFVNRTAPRQQSPQELGYETMIRGLELIYQNPSNFGYSSPVYDALGRDAYDFVMNVATGLEIIGNRRQGTMGRLIVPTLEQAREIVTASFDYVTQAGKKQLAASRPKRTKRSKVRG